MLVVDSVQGVEAQTINNLYLAHRCRPGDHPVINKIDLAAARVDYVTEQFVDLIGCAPEEIIKVSAKTGVGIEELLRAVVDRVPHPTGDPDAPAQALIFDSMFDSYVGAVAYVRMFTGSIRKGQKIRVFSNERQFEVGDIGWFQLARVSQKGLSAGEVGYIATGAKDVRHVRVGDTITLAETPCAAPWPGYAEAKPMVFSGLYPTENDQYNDLLAPGHPHQRRPRGQPVHDRARGQGLRVGQQDVCQAEGADPAPDVRGGHPGGHRHQGDLAHHGEGTAQERDRQVLRRRHQPQAEAAGEAEGRQETHEAGRAGGDPAGSLPGHAQGGALMIDGLPVLKLPALREPRQGDIIVFEYPRDRNLDYIKRCVAVAGDSVAVREGVLYVNGKVYESNLGQYGGDHSCIPTWTDPESCPPPRAKKDQGSYVRNARNHSFPWEGLPDPYVVPAGHIFMMGDNRYNSMDSRYWGPLDKKLIKGKALFIYWSWDNERHLPRFSRLGDAIR
jgi:signal peptidase I